MTLQQIIEASKERDKNVQSAQGSAADIFRAAGGSVRGPVRPGSENASSDDRVHWSADMIDWNPGVTGYAKQRALDRANGVQERLNDYVQSFDDAMRKASEEAESRRGEIIMSNLGKGGLIAGSLWAGGAALGGAGGLEGAIGASLSSVGLPAMTLPEIALFGGAAYAGGKMILADGPRLGNIEGSGLDFRGDINFTESESVPEVGRELAPIVSGGGGGVSLAGNYGDFWGDIKGVIDRPDVPAARHDDSILFEGMV